MLLIHEEIQATVERLVGKWLADGEHRVFIYPAGNGKYGVQVVWHGFRNKSVSTRAVWGHELRQELGIYRPRVSEIKCRTPDEFVWPDERAFRFALKEDNSPEG